MKGKRPIILAFVLLGFYALILAMCGCAQKTLVAPSTARTQAAITSAKRANAEVGRYNDINYTTGQRIEAKAKVIEKYWK